MIPVVCIDGPGGAGKGTVAKAVATELGYHLLDSGAIYRVMALAVQKQALDTENMDALVECAQTLDVKFITPDSGLVETWLQGENVTAELRLESTAEMASLVAAKSPVRDALMQRQRDFAQAPGLVADGRDMGTIVFPEAPVKVFLTASAEERAKRRHKQLQEQGKSVSIARLLKAIEERDARDMNRSVAPLQPAEDAITIDTTELNITEVVTQVLERVNQSIASNT
ncbi:MAG: (d)CMP kinase [Gammaproteobacteria bacterium]